MHRRSAERLLLRRIRSTIFSTCFYDKDQQEIVSRVTRQDLLSLVSEPVEVGLFPDVEKGEVLVDSRGEGSFQRRWEKEGWSYWSKSLAIARSLEGFSFAEPL